MSIPLGSRVVNKRPAADITWRQKFGRGNNINSGVTFEKGMHHHHHHNASKIHTPRKRSNNRTLSLLNWLLIAFFIILGNFYSYSMLTAHFYGASYDSGKGKEHHHADLPPLQFHKANNNGNTALLTKKHLNKRQNKSSSSLRKQRNMKVNLPPKPDGWEQMGYYSIRKHFSCSDYAHDTTKPLPTMEYWQFLRETYLKHVDPDIIFDDAVPPNKGYNFDNASPPPYYAGHGDRGRGLFASRDITKGELVHDGTKSDFVFPTGMSWRRLIFNLSQNAACDVVDWSWTQQIEENGEYKLFLAINISILFNGGFEDTMNIKPPTSYSSKFYALRDIRKGEELLYDYDMYDTVWGKVGLGSI